MNFKVRCIESGPCHNKGEIYEVNSGRILKNDGQYSTCGKFDSVESLNSRWLSQFELVKEEKTMTKDDLKVGYVVELRDKSLQMLVETNSNKGFVNIGHWDPLSGFDENLINKQFKSCDVLKVYGFARDPFESLKVNTNGRTLLWERKESPVEITLQEIADWKKTTVDLVRIKE